MYLLKCDKCNSLIEVKTEFLMLCPKCKTKLNNNFQDWKKRKENKGKNFMNYLDQVCISSEMLEEMQKAEALEKKYSPKKNKTRKIINIAAQAVALAITLALSQNVMFMLGEAWMRNALTAICISIPVAVGIGATVYTLRRKLFQDFVPVLLAVAGVLATIVAAMVFFILTNNM